MCIHNSIYAQLKAWANSFTTERQQGSVRRSLLLCYCLGFGKFPINSCVLYSPGWTNFRTTIKTEILPLNVDNHQLVTFFCSQWMSFGQNLLQLVYWQICETCNLRVFSDLFLLLIGSGPKRSMPIEKFWIVLHWFLPYFKEKENCIAA